MSYYAWNSAHEPVQPITAAPGSAASGLGAYYAWNSSHEPVVPINGLSGSAEGRESDQALRALIDRRPPVAVMGEWAKQVTDLVWKDVPHDTQLTLLPITDRDLNRARAGAFGTEAPAVGVLMKKPRSLADQALSFAGTPYEPRLALAVYSLTDTGRVAVPRFLTIATLRDIGDKARGAQSVEHAARHLRGTLVYVVSLPRKPGQRKPGASFREVWKAMAVGATPEPPPPRPATPAPAASSSAVGILPWVLGGSVAAGVAWWLITRSSA